jgi:hypothetical protein
MISTRLANRSDMGSIVRQLTVTMQWISLPLYTEHCRRFNGVGERRVGLDGEYESPENVRGLFLVLHEQCVRRIR